MDRRAAGKLSEREKVEGTASWSIVVGFYEAFPSHS